MIVRFLTVQNNSQFPSTFARRILSPLFFATRRSWSEPVLLRVWHGASRQGDQVKSFRTFPINRLLPALSEQHEILGKIELFYCFLLLDSQGRKNSSHFDSLPIYSSSSTGDCSFSITWLVSRISWKYNAMRALKMPTPVILSIVDLTVVILTHMRTCM